MQIVSGAWAEADVVVFRAGECGLQFVPALREGVDAVLPDGIVRVVAGVPPGDGWLYAPVGIAGQDLLAVAHGGVGPFQVVGQVGQFARLVLSDHQQRPAELSLLHHPLKAPEQLHPFHHADIVERMRRTAELPRSARYT